MDEKEEIVEEVTPEEEVVPTEKTLTQSQVNELVGKARQEGRESAMRELLERYGVGAEQEMDELLGKGQGFDVLNDEYNTSSTSLKEALAENALLKAKADAARWEDIKLILGGKGLDVTLENINQLLPTHPEWTGAPPLPPAVRKLGGEAEAVNNGNMMDEIDEEKKVNKLFGLEG